ncbi:MAG: sulfate ABC transporter ATP-binding protein, partial [Mycobacteriaceae bacterium]|nr:sulfate ABC transporter ATP-binding protein [Mycobacteriaceae bacterium]
GDAEALALREGDTVYVRATRVPEIAGSTQLPRRDESLAPAQTS